MKFILAVSLGLGLGALYEIAEFFTDRISHPVPPSQPSLLDTDLDLIANALGALLAGACYFQKLCGQGDLMVYFCKSYCAPPREFHGGLYLWGGSGKRALAQERLHN